MDQSQKEWLTGVVFDERLATHYNTWNKDFTERPQRITRSIERCNELGLLQRCKHICLRNATETEILTCHTRKHIELLKSTESMNEEQMKAISQKYDYIYFHKKSYENAVLALGGIIDLVDEVVSGKVRNGMAIVRPPGHHAMKEEFCGYCYFGNVAIAAQLALDKYHLKRILVLDWDVHHGQGSQFKFYNDPRVLFVSIHRYEHGKEWPYLRESDYDYIGEGPGRGYSINIPLNEVGCGNSEYLSIFFNLLLPIFNEFDPELVLVSAGFDSALGCPEGEMAVTPACFAHFVNILMPLASGKLVLMLEGGYNLKSLSESVALSLRTLLGDPAPKIAPLSAPKPSVVETVLNCIKVLHPYWRSLRYQDLLETKDIHFENYPYPGVLNLPPVQGMKFVTPESRPDSFPLIQECTNKIAIKQLESYNHILDNLIQETSLRCAEQKLGIICDRKDSDLYRHLKMKDLWSQCQPLEESCSGDANAGDCVKACIDSILSYKVQSSVCIVQTCHVHHKYTNDEASHVCTSNIDLAVHYAAKNNHKQKTLVVELGVSSSHQQTCFMENSSVLYISLTWPGFQNKDPSQFTANSCCNGIHKAETIPQCVHVCFKEDVMNSGDLLSVLFQIVLPLSYEFCPDLVILTWRNPFGLSEGSRSSFFPACMRHVTQLLLGLAQGRLLLLIENDSSITCQVRDGNRSDISSDISLQVVSECLSVLLGGICGTIGQIVPSERTVAAIKQAQDSLKSTWKVFQFRRFLQINFK